MDKLVKDKLAEFVRECGIKRYPNEACGLVYSDDKGKPHFVECKNASISPQHHFLIDPNEYLQVCELGEVVACWHTHCETEPVASSADKQGCKNTQVPWLIGAIFKDGDKFNFKGLTLVEVDDGFEMPLLGRPYSFGVFDCFSLMRDYYKRELDIELPELPRCERVWTSEPDYMAKMAEKRFDLVRMPEGATPQIGDLFFIQTGLEGADHIGIYLGDDRILHQMRDRLSRRDIYGGSYWQEHTLSHWRHKSKC